VYYYRDVFVLNGNALIVYIAFIVEVANIRQHSVVCTVRQVTGRAQPLSNLARESFLSPIERGKQSSTRHVRVTSCTPEHMRMCSSLCGFRHWLCGCVVDVLYVLSCTMLDMAILTVCIEELPNQRRSEPQQTTSGPYSLRDHESWIIA